MTSERKIYSVSEVNRNPLLFGMMQRMDLVEKVGSGLKRIHDMCVAHPCVLPVIEADSDWYRFVLRRPESRVPVEVPVELTETEKKILAMLGETPMGRRDLLSGLGYSKRTGNYVRALENLQNAHLIEMTLPGKPNSRLQKYRLTDKGRKRIEE